MLKIIILLVFISCGKDNTILPPSNCSTYFSAIKHYWVSDITNNAYDISSCNLFDWCLINNQVELFIGEGYLYINYYNEPREILGQWQVCNGVLEFYNLNDGSSPETFR